MKRSRAWIRPAILAALLLAFIWWLRLEHVDPRYQGRRTSEWLHALNSDSEEEIEQAEQAVFILGERAVPQVSKFFFARELEWRTKLYDWIEHKINWGPEREDVDELQRIGRDAVEILGRRAVGMVPQLVESLGDEKSDYGSRDALDKIGDAGNDYLKSSLTHKNHQTRFEAARILFERRQADICPQMKELLKVDRPDLRAVSMVSLALFNPSQEETLALIRPHLHSSDEVVRTHAVEVLGYLAYYRPDLIPEFLTFLDDKSEFVRQRVAGRLSALSSKDPAAFDALVRSLRDSHVEVKRVAYYSLCEMLGMEFFTERFPPSFDVSILASKKLNPSFALPYHKVEKNADMVDQRGEEILAVILGQLNAIAGVSNPVTDLRLMAESAWAARISLENDTRPYVRNVLAELETQENFERWRPLEDSVQKGKITIRDESWAKILKQLALLESVKASTAVYVYQSIYYGLGPPPAAYTNIYKPKSP